MKLQMLPRFPAIVQGINGDAVSKASGVYSIGPAYGTLPTLGAPVDLSQVFARVLQGGVYYQFPISNFPAAAISNTVSTVNADYTVQNSDKGKTLALGGATFNTITLGAAAGYISTFMVVLSNTDTRAKKIVLTGGDTFRLWPGQSVLLVNVNNVWQAIGRSRYKLPTGVTTIYVNSIVGDDNSDGLSPGAATGGHPNAMATVQAAFYRAANEFDWQAYPGISSVVVTMGANDTTGLHWGPQGLVGGISGNNLVLDGGGNVISCVTDSAIHLFFGAMLYIQNLIMTNSANHGALQMEHGAKCIMKAGNGFAGGGAGSHIGVDSNSSLEIDNDYFTSGNAGYLAIASNGGLIRFAVPGTNISMGSDATYTTAVIAIGGGICDFQNATFVLNGHTIIGKRWEADNLGLVVSGTGAPNTFFPGNANGTTSGGGQGV